MTTKRSLNKLERKAHMNIHNTKEVVEETEGLSNYTRDRFGKKHPVNKGKNERENNVSLS